MTGFNSREDAIAYCETSIRTQAQEGLSSAMGAIATWGLEPQPDPRDEKIARLVEAATNYHNAIEGSDGRGGMLVKIETVNKCGDELRADLAAAKAVQHG
jgi:hypothetical protein